MLMPSPWFKSRRIYIRVASLSLESFRRSSVLSWGLLISYINLYHLFACQIYHIFSLHFVGVLELYLRRWNMTFWDTEMKGLSRSSQINIPNTRSLIRTPQVCVRHLAEGRSLHGGKIYTNTYMCALPNADVIFQTVNATFFTCLLFDKLVTLISYYL